MTYQTKAERLTAGETFITKEGGNSMVPLIHSKQPYRLAPCTWEQAQVGDILYCRVKGNFFTHLVKAKDDVRGVLIGNNRGGTNGWTKAVYGKVVEVLPFKNDTNGF